LKKPQQVKNLTIIPGIGKSIAEDLWNIGITEVDQLIGKDPDQLYKQSNEFSGAVQDRCLLYVFRCAVYFAETRGRQQDKKKLKWWNWKDKK